MISAKPTALGRTDAIKVRTNKCSDCQKTLPKVS